MQLVHVLLAAAPCWLTAMAVLATHDSEALSDMATTDSWCSSVHLTIISPSVSVKQYGAAMMRVSAGK